MSKIKIAVTAGGAIALVILTDAAWTWLTPNPIRDPDTRILWLSVAGLALLLAFNLFMPGWLVVLLIAATAAVASTEYIQPGTPSTILYAASALVFLVTIAGGTAVLGLISFVRHAPANYRKNQLASTERASGGTRPAGPPVEPGLQSP